MKQPDRFERSVRSVSSSDDCGFRRVYEDDAVKLLHKEHAWVRRQLRDISKISLGEAAYQNGLDIAVQEMMYRLDQRRK